MSEGRPAIAPGEQVSAVYMTTGEPYIDEPDTCPTCGGDGWYVGHEDECYDTGDCVCSGVQARCECQERAE